MQLINEPPDLYLHCLPSSLWIQNLEQLIQNIFFEIWEMLILLSALFGAWGVKSEKSWSVGLSLLRMRW